MLVFGKNVDWGYLFMRTAVENKGIQYLVHFTRAENLESILQNGLISVDSLDSREMDYHSNDEYRLDNCCEATCLSIQFPNYKMFYKYRCENPGSDWVVLGIQKDVLWEKDCAFCVENAASSNVTSIPLRRRKGVDAFNLLYNNYPGKPSRESLGISRELPTHPQAEVLVFDIIEPEYILGVAFNNLNDRNKYSDLIPPNMPVKVAPGLFSYRGDYEHW